MHIYVSILILLFFNSFYAAHSSPTKGSVALLPSVAPALRKNVVNNLESVARPLSPTKVMIVKSSASKSTTNNVEDAVSSSIDSNTEDEEDGDEAVSANQIDIINKNNDNNNNNIDKDQDQESQDNNARSTNNILGTAVSPGNSVDVPIAQPPLSDIIADAHVPISKTADATNTDEATTATTATTTTTTSTSTPTSPTTPTTPTTPTSPTTAEKVSVVAATTADPPLPTSVSTTPTNNADVATPRTELSTYIPSLNSELQFIDFAPLSLTASKEYLGIGHSMQARFVWTPTLWDLTNSTGGVMGSGPREGTVQNQYICVENVVKLCYIRTVVIISLKVDSFRSSSFFFYNVRCNHSFKTNPNSVY